MFSILIRSKMIITGKLYDVNSKNLERIYQRLVFLSIGKESWNSQRISNIGNSFCNSSSNNIENIKQELTIKHNHMNYLFDNSAWQHVEWLNTELERNLIKQEIHWGQRDWQTWFYLEDKNNNYFQTMSILKISITLQKLNMSKITTLRTWKKKFLRHSSRSFARE